MSKEQSRLAVIGTLGLMYLMHGIFYQSRTIRVFGLLLGDVVLVTLTIVLVAAHMYIYRPFKLEIKITRPIEDKTNKVPSAVDAHIIVEQRNISKKEEKLFIRDTCEATVYSKSALDEFMTSTAWPSDWVVEINKKVKA